MNAASKLQYVVAVVLVVVAVLSDDKVLALVGAWLGPSAVTILKALLPAVRKSVTKLPEDEDTNPIELR